MKNKINSSINSLMNLIISTAICVFGVASTVGYACNIFFPEILSSTVVLISSVVTVVVAIIFYFKIEQQTYVAFFCILCFSALLFESVRDGILHLVYIIYQKAIIVTQKANFFLPDYSFGNDVHPIQASIVTFVIFISLIFAIVYIRAFIKTRRFLIPFFTSLITAVLVFIAKERNSSIYMLLIISICLVLLSINLQMRAHKKGKANEKEITYIFGRSAIILMIMFSLSFLFYNKSAEISYQINKIGAKTGINDWLSNSTSSGGGGIQGGGDSTEFPKFAISQTFSGVEMIDIYPNRDPIFGVILQENDAEPYNGTLYFNCDYFYEFGVRSWIAEKNAFMLFSKSSELINKNVKKADIFLHKKYNGNEDIINAFPKLSYSDNYSQYDFSKNKKALSSDAYIPYSPTATDFLIKVDKAASQSTKRYPAPAKQSVPESLALDFAKLADDILEKYPEYTINNSMGKVYAVTKYLKENMTYTTSPTKGKNYSKYDERRDALYNFLFVTHEGYCVHYATSAALILRAMNVQTRYVTGYSAKYDSKNGTYLSDANAHAWIEVFVDSLGWVPVEVTFSNFQPVVSEESTAETSKNESNSDTSNVSMDNSANTKSEVESSNITMITSVENANTSNSFGGIGKSLVVFVIAACVLSFGFFIAFYLRVSGSKFNKRIKLYTAAANGKILPENQVYTIRKIYRDSVVLLGLLGIKAEPGEQVSHFALRVDNSFQDIPRLSEVIDVFMCAEFGGQVKNEDVILCGNYIIAQNTFVKTKLPFYKRIFYQLTRKII